MTLVRGNVKRRLPFHIDRIQIQLGYHFFFVVISTDITITIIRITIFTDIIDIMNRSSIHMMFQQVLDYLGIAHMTCRLQYIVSIGYSHIGTPCRDEDVRTRFG